MLDPFVQKAFEKIKDANLAPAYLEQINLLELHVSFLADKLALAEKDAAKAESKLEDAQTIVDELRTQLASFEGKAKQIDIGPCLVKETREGHRLEGVYCPHCASLLAKGQYTAYSETFTYMCLKCNFELPSDDVERAFADFPK